MPGGTKYEGGCDEGNATGSCSMGPWMVRTSFTGSMGKLMVVKCKARSSFLLETTNTRWVC